MEQVYISGSFDQNSISLKENYEVEYWTNKLGINREVLIQAVNSVGTSVSAVINYLN